MTTGHSHLRGRSALTAVSADSRGLKLSTVRRRTAAITRAHPTASLHSLTSSVNARA